MSDIKQQYKVGVIIRSALCFKKQYIQEVFIDENIKELEIETKARATGYATYASFQMSSVKDEDKALILLEKVSQSLVGYVSMVYGEEVELESIYLTNLENNEYIQQQEDRWQKSIRIAEPLDKVPIFTEAERLSLYWVGKGNASTRTDDKLSCYYAAAEALIDPETKKQNAKDVCESCGRSFPTRAMQRFLLNECKVDKAGVDIIISYRGNIVHGTKSSITHYLEFMEASDKLLKAVSSYFKERHSLSYYPSQISIGSKFRIYGMSVPGE